jgi:hypothetical protein
MEDQYTALELHEQFAADVNLMVANVISGRMEPDDAIAELRDKGLELSEMLKEIK